jgi:hypothetical protein
MRKTKSNMRRDAVRPRSSIVPPDIGAKKRSMMRSEKPAAARASRALVSGLRNNPARGTEVTRRRMAAKRSLSSGVPIGASAVASAAPGRRTGSVSRTKRPPVRTRTPGSKRCSSSPR